MFEFHCIQDIVDVPRARNGSVGFRSTIRVAQTCSVLFSGVLDNTKEKLHEMAKCLYVRLMGKEGRWVDRGSVGRAVSESQS